MSQDINGAHQCVDTRVLNRRFFHLPGGTGPRYPEVNTLAICTDIDLFRPWNAKLAELFVSEAVSADGERSVCFGCTLRAHRTQVASPPHVCGIKNSINTGNLAKKPSHYQYYLQVYNAI